LEEIRSKVRELAEELGRRGIRVSKVYLFGSYARGDFVETSDIDLIIISEDFKNMKLSERLSLLYSLFGEDASLIPLTEDELEEKRKSSVVVRDASRYWVEVYP